MLHDEEYSDQFHYSNIKRAIEEHLRHIKNNCLEKFAIAKYFLENARDKQKFKLLKSVNLENILDAYESFHMHKFRDKLMNIKPSEISGELFSVFVDFEPVLIVDEHLIERYNEHTHTYDDNHHTDWLEYFSY